MPTNQEFLNQLAAESPEKLKAWFDAEHNDTLTAKNDVRGDSAHSNDGNAHLKASEDLSDGFTDSRGQLEADINAWAEGNVGFSIWLTDFREAMRGWLYRQAMITAHANTELIENQANTIIRLQQQVDKLTAERDNLAEDLNDMMRSMDELCDRFRDASSSALDNAHEIQRIIDNFWTV